MQFAVLVLMIVFALCANCHYTPTSAVCPWLSIIYCEMRDRLCSPLINSGHSELIIILELIVTIWHTKTNQHTLWCWPKTELCSNPFAFSFHHRYTYFIARNARKFKIIYKLPLPFIIYISFIMTGRKL